jgi:hypothetical protein
MYQMLSFAHGWQWETSLDILLALVECGTSETLLIFWSYSIFLHIVNYVKCMALFFNLLFIVIIIIILLLLHTFLEICILIKSIIRNKTRENNWN